MAIWHSLTVPYHSMRDPDQLQALLDAVLLIESDLDLPVVLKRIAEAARSLTDATYGALGVLAPDSPASRDSGKRLSEFVHVGMDEEVVARIGHLPGGAGILGTLIADPRPLRLADLGQHPDSVGFP
ncbi:MAG TPA: hypothetical protein VGS21_03355, partial [Acidimicrobiales bacterium]|nr:hypothetical protein [Acidimicrobiales bacterium]